MNIESWRILSQFVTDVSSHHFVALFDKHENIQALTDDYFPAQPQKTNFERGGSRDAFESEDTTGRTSRRWNKAKVRGSEILYLESI